MDPIQGIQKYQKRLYFENWILVIIIQWHLFNILTDINEMRENSLKNNQLFFNSLEIDYRKISINNLKVKLLRV